MAILVFFFAALIMSFHSLASADSNISHSRKVASLPSKVIVGYANWQECDDKLIQAVKDGVNVLIWFSINLIASPVTGKPMIQGGPDIDCVAGIIQTIRDDLKLPTVHLMSIGGWDSPHPDTTNSVEDVYAAWHEWNTVTIARPDKGFYGFDGFDWDIEGNDDPSSPYNTFTVDCLNLMGGLSQKAKSQGYIVSMAPAESYVDLTTSVFDRSLTHEYPEWTTLQPGFAYHGHNAYSYLLHRFATTTSAVDGSSQPTFDFVTIQLYEGYSHAQYNITIAGQSAVDFLVSFVQRASAGWTVDFSTDAQLAYPQVSTVSVPHTRLVVGLANGWAGDGKFLLIYPEHVGAAYSALSTLGTAPLGFAFWDILDEGKASPMRPKEPVWLAKGLNQFLKIREE